MLSLLRYPGQAISIYCPNGDVIQITAVDVRNGGVILGFEASLDYRIVRNELENPNHKREARQNKLAYRIKQLRDEQQRLES